jgi:hypothetical protein
LETGTPARVAATSRPATIWPRQTAGPSTLRAGCSQPLDQKLAALVEKRVVDGGAAEIDPGDDFFSG